MARKKNPLIVAVCLVAFSMTIHGYIMPPPLTLEKLEAEADFIFKGTAVSSAPSKDDSFKPWHEFAGWETKFKVISVIKGDASGETVGFRHYDKAPAQPARGFGKMGPDPVSHHFEPSQSYVVFAKKADAVAVFRQLRIEASLIPDEGVLKCTDDAAVTGRTVKGIVWSGLVRMLKSADASNVTYAIKHLETMSAHRGHYSGTQDFSREEVADAVHAQMIRSEPEIARAAITVIGSGNPYCSEERAEYWLATVGSADVPGLAKMDPKMKNPSGESRWKELTAIAGGKTDAATRALAIRALGLVRKPELMEATQRWIADPEPAVRASAALLLADFLGAEANRLLTALASDPAAEVRVCVAHSVGFAQQSELAGLLGKLLTDDPDAKVRRAASVSLLSFSPKHEAVATVFRENTGNQEFSPLFLNALAAEDPHRYLDALAEVVAKKPEPKNWSGGQIPAFTAFNILFKHLQAQPQDEVRAGKFDRCLDALEKGYTTGSSEPRDIYAFYLQRGMTERAKKYRAAANRAASYDLDYFFKQVDQAPQNFTRY